MPNKRPGKNHFGSGVPSRVRPEPAVSAMSAGAARAVGEAQDGEVAQVGDLLDQARAALGSLGTCSPEEGHAEIYAEVHRLLTEALRATAADV